MSDLRVDTAARLVHHDGVTLPCVIGRSGAIPARDKREGDGATPLGHWPIRGVLLRRDRVSSLELHVAWRWLRPADGWSDDRHDPDYNRPVRHPYRFGAERLWRDDELYDAIVVLGHNDAPPAKGLGSAIFLHVAPQQGATEGCVAIDRAALLALLPSLRAGDRVRIE